MIAVDNAWEARRNERGEVRSCNPETEFRKGFAAGATEATAQKLNAKIAWATARKAIEATDKALAERDASRQVNAEFLAARGDMAAHDREVAKAAVLDYVSTKDVPRVLLEFSNQPMFDSWIDAAKATALDEAATFLAQPYTVWHGDGGVTVRTDMSGMPVKLTDWLHARAAEYRAVEK